MSHDGRVMLSVPHVERRTFDHNFLRIAAFEVRFPTLLEISREMIAPVHKAARKEYPHYTPEKSMRVLPMPSTPDEVELEHKFQSREGDWAFVVKPAAVIVETRAYKSFDDLLHRIRRVLGWVRPILDTDFFTRVGLRYVNALPLTDASPRGWVNDSLVQPLVEGVYGTVSKYTHEIRGWSDVGQYTFRHGYSEGSSRSAAEYLLDFDFWEESVTDAELIQRVEGFNERCFDFFMWCLGPTGRAHLVGDIGGTAHGVR